LPEPILTSRFETALAFAARLHASQVRKDTEIPYVSHLLGTASLALEHGADEDEAIAALLHDAIEDQGGTPTATVIEWLFGPRVRYIVAGCSDSSGDGPKAPYKKRKKAYIKHLKGANHSVRLVSASDKLHNARAILADLRRIGPAVFDRFNAPRKEVLWYYASLANEFKRGGPYGLAVELEIVVNEIERLVPEGDLTSG
jgi:GTP pyrophosphokinase